MPIEKRPTNPLPSDYVPPGGIPYKVKTHDELGSVARNNGVPEHVLVAFNFGTNDPAEINWYLRRNVGCVRATHDHKNWMFTSEATPGIIYLPPPWHRPSFPTTVAPVPVSKTEPQKSLLKDVWAGLGKAHSGDLFVIGAHDLTAKVYNLGDDLSNVRNAVVNFNGWKFGLGLGADVGAVLVLAHGYPEAKDMIGVSGDKDFDISIGTKLGDFLKDIKGVGKVIDGIEKYKKLRYLVENAIKSRAIAETGLYTLPIPFAGVGLHLWLGFKFGDVSVFSKGVGIP
jgi:hypothetical protein